MTSAPESFVLGAGLQELVAADAMLELLATGFGFTEGPVWDAGRQELRFSDLEHDVRRRWRDDDGVAVVARDTSRANGMVLDAQGRLLVCEHVSSCLVRIDADGGREVLARTFEGRELNSPNDVVVRSDGTIYFTDPPYGRINDTHGTIRPQELDFQAVFSFSCDGALVARARDFVKPNGLCFSPDETVLYVADTEQMHVRRFEVSADGALGGGEIFFEPVPDAPGFPDGMRVDERGNLWTTGPGGLFVVDPAGVLLGRIALPEIAANLAFGGADLREVFVTATTGLYRLRTLVAGAHLPHLATSERTHA
ncbi:MAG: SMP-30/gluconolactonase/LRE family protein [Gaiella sp.]